MSFAAFSATTKHKIHGYSPAVDSPQGEVAGPKGTGTANGQDYYGVDGDEGCKPETALACGTIECKA